MPLEPVRFYRETLPAGLVTEIELEDWSYDQTLNRPGSFSAKVPVTSTDADDSLLDPWRTGIYAVRGGQVEWGGILLPPKLEVGGTAHDISAFGWLGYWDHRVIRNIVGQPEAGGQVVAKPIDDATDTDVGPLPQGSTMWADVAGGYSTWVGIVPAPGNAGTWRSHMSVPTAGLNLHPIASVTVGIIATLTAFTVQTVTPEVYIGGVKYAGTGKTLLGGYRPTDCSYTWTVNPATGIAWTPADIYAFNTGGSTAGFTTGVASTFVDLVVNQVWMVVTYQTGFSDYFANTDQFEIFKALVDDAQSQTKFGEGYDLGIKVVWDRLSGVMRDRLVGYESHLAKNLGDALRQLCALENGFDMSPEFTINPLTNRIDKQIRLTYPNQGRYTNFVFEYERGRHTNVLGRGFADPVEFAWAGDGWGSGNDATRLRSPYIDTTLRNVYPPYDAAPAWSSVVLQPTLDEHTAAAFARTNRPRRIPVLQVDPNGSPRWGDYNLGDVVTIKVTDGYGSTRPEGERNRLTGWKVSEGDVIELTFADPLGLVGEDLP